LFAGSLADKYGRKNLLYAAAILFLTSSLGTAFAPNIIFFQIFRFVGGLAVGIASVASPMYIAEISPAEKRGRMVSVNQLAITTGILVAFFTNYLLVHTGDNNWRWMLLVMAVPAILFLCMLFTVPKSPRWLISVGRFDEAKGVLNKIVGKEKAEQEFNNIRQSLGKEEEKSTLKSILKSKYKYVLIVGIFIAIFQQITGINTIMYYAPIIFDSLGFSMNSALFQTILIGSINLIFTIVSMFLIDKVGRKPLLLVGSGIMAVSLGILAFLIKGQIGGYWILVLILVYIASYAISLGPVTWVLVSEIFPNKYRGLGMSISTMFLWIAAFFVALTFPSILSGLGASNTFLLFMGICAASFLFYLLCIKETKNTKLEDIE
jgi:sugar porter (SP) family MFS transporter